jgi:hypothetical protein
MRIARVILSPSAEGVSGSGAGAPPSPAPNNQPEGAGVPPPAPPAPVPPVAPPSAPPAASIVAGDGPTEFSANLAKELEAERQKRIDRERRVSELEDENQQLKRVTRAAPVAKKDPWTFFG